MSLILLRVAASAVIIAGTALAVWLSKRNRRQYSYAAVDAYREDVTHVPWEHPRGDEEARRESDQCAVCLENLQGGIICLPCHHQLHQKCAETLFVHYKNNSCPMCRRRVNGEYLRRKGLSLNGINTN